MNVHFNFFVLVVIGTVKCVFGSTLTILSDILLRILIMLGMNTVIF